MRSKEEIYLEIYNKAPSLMNFYDYKRTAIEAMEEYGKLMYNQALFDVVNIPYSGRQGSEIEKLKK